MKRRPVPIHETGYICASLAMVSGFLETYTYLLKGGVFANAQTGNFALLGMAIAHGDVKKVFTYLIPMCFYVVGIAMTVTMPRLLDENKLLRWDTVFVALEIGLLFVVGLKTKTRLYSTLLLAGEYGLLNNKLSVGAMYTARFAEPKTLNELTFLATFRPKNWLNAAISYSPIQASGKSIGLAVKLGPLFVGTDYMFFGGNSKSVNGFLGISFPLGGKPKPFSEL